MNTLTPSVPLTSADEAPVPDIGRRAALVALAVYGVVLVWVLLLKAHVSHFEELFGRRSVNLVPFADMGGSGELVLNVVSFVPLGLLLGLAARRPGVRLLVPVVATALSFEVVQFALGIGATDVTDLITNTIGGAAGLGLCLPILRAAGDRARPWLLGGLVVVLFAAVGGFVAWLEITGVRFRL